MKIIYFIRNSLHMYPPCLSQILYLDDLGQDLLVCFGSCDPTVKKILDERNIEYIDFNIQRNKNKYLGKIQSYSLYRKKVKEVLDSKYNEKDVLWFGTADSIFFLKKIVESKRYVMSILELYDDNDFYRKEIGKYINRAELVIACEYMRSRIMKSWWNLDEVPTTIPNKPYTHPREKHIIGSTSLTKDLIDQIRGKKIILYQGIISADRDLYILAKTLKQMDSDYYLVLMGQEFFDSVKIIRELYPKTIYLGFVPAPLHLEITSYANIGIANYDDSSLNNLFCAPNKIYEYSGFDIPMLCSNVIGLENTVGDAKAGICCDFEDTKSISAGLHKIIENQKDYSANAKVFFEQTNNLMVMEDVVTKLKKMRE
ncbi:hypothetical protein [Vagococcus jeotgali]|uniref:hypothetical protein n=1 Tax=Vagococcus jeotgali TaxID=3109030 RepID=UPI002DD9258E|nr:hypothetical protein [Vagococcus sp. B2T-5]